MYYYLPSTCIVDTAASTHSGALPTYIKVILHLVYLLSVLPDTDTPDPGTLPMFLHWYHPYPYLYLYLYICALCFL